MKGTFLEASAGTGKTYAISKLVKPGALVMTFTRAAVKELKQRIDVENVDIFTIHGFCERLLRELGGERWSELITTKELRSIVRDFFRTKVTEENYLPAQLHPSIEDKLVRMLSSGTKIIAPPPLKEMKSRIEKMHISIDVMEEIYRLAPHYKGICDRDGNIKEIEKIEKFADQVNRWDLNFLVAEGVIFYDLFAEKNKKVKATKKANLDFWKELNGQIDLIRQPQAVLARMAADCQQLLFNYMKKHDKYRYDDLLLKTYQLESIPKRYEMVIVDEFQDTDPLQWGIIQRLFGDAEIYLVGDPKQSIYAFRQADIYTYLSAKDNFLSISTLDTNYRSNPALVEGLNTLFKGTKFPLPKTNSALTYQPVKSGVDAAPIKDPIQFWMAEGHQGRSKKWPTVEMEETLFFPKIARTIAAPYAEWAILVRDRFQAERISDYLDQCNIPNITQRSRLLTDSEAYFPLVELLRAIIDPLKYLKQVLGGPLYCWTHHDLLERDLLPLFEKFTNYLDIWKKSGIGPSFQAAIAFPTTEMKQLVDHLIVYEYNEKTSPEELLKYLEELTEEDELVAMQDTTADCVKILTIHMSKGLEFENVIPLGLTCRTAQKELWKYGTEGGVPTLEPLFTPETEEKDAEKMRQLYVALTRAKSRLYIPYALHDQDPKPGEGSPLELYVQNWSAFPHEMLEPSEMPKHVAEKADVPLLVYPPLTFHPIEIQSFSSIAQTQTTHYEQTPRDFESQEKTFQTLPAGAQTGLVIHTLLEEASFKKVNEMSPWIQSKLLGSRYEPWCEVITEMVYRALTTPLGDLPPLCEMEQVWREAEFLTPNMKGVIDVAFIYEGKGYMLDWKTNWLPDYSQESLHKAMQDHDYYLQARIYKEAFSKYLKLFGLEFGSAYYAFVRGGLIECSL